MANHKRPLSPHLQIYKPQITSVLSISHRFTGIALALGLPVLVWFLVEIAFGVLESSLFHSIFTHPLGTIMLMGWTYALAFHLCNGIRHLLWDVGWGFELDTVKKTGWAVVAGSVGFTILFWVCVFSQEGSPT